MATLEFYRSEATRCRELAAKSADREVAQRWLQLAIDYDRLAKNALSDSRRPDDLTRD